MGGFWACRRLGVTNASSAKGRSVVRLDMSGGFSSRNKRDFRD
jgi:hypothetical protein